MATARRPLAASGGGAAPGRRPRSAARAVDAEATVPNRGHLGSSNLRRGVPEWALWDRGRLQGHVDAPAALTRGTQASPSVASDTRPSTSSRKTAHRVDPRGARSGARRWLHESDQGSVFGARLERGPAELPQMTPVSSTISTPP